MRCTRPYCRGPRRTCQSRWLVRFRRTGDGCDHGSKVVYGHGQRLGRNNAIANLIRENKVAQMYSSIQTGNNIGMQTLDQNLADLVRRNIVSPAEARGKAKFPENFPG